MKKILVFILGLAALCACTKEQPGYVIKGQAGDLNGKAEFAYELPDGTQFTDEAALSAGKFTFKGSVPDVVSAGVTLTPDGGDPLRFNLYVENCPIEITVNPDKVIDYAQYGGKVLPDVVVTGGRSNEFSNALADAQKAVGQLPEYKELAAAQQELQEMGYTDMEAYQAKSQEISQKFADVMEGYYEKQQKAIQDCIAQFPDAEAALYMFDIYNSSASTEEYEAGFNNFTEKVRNSYLAQNAREELASRKATMPGAVAPDFTLNDPEGKPVTLSSLRGQYVIVDFWASWCKPCRAGNPAMKELYAKYHDKGLEIIGVSDDTDHNAWKQAIEQDQTPWIHVVDEFPVEHKPARVGTLWGVHYIPAYFLLDKEGKIIGKMEHEELEAKLAELLP